MRIFSNSFELMSELGRELNSYGQTVKPKTYQNKVIEGNDDFITKEVICQQYCLTSLGDPVWLFIFSKSKEWADAEFQERISFDPSYPSRKMPWNPGKAWELRKDLWEQFLDEEGLFDYTYSERMAWVLPDLIELLKNDSDTRKAVLPIFNGTGEIDTIQYSGSKRIPCSMYYDFLIRENGKGEKVLHICYHQRSSDFVTHFGNDVYLAWRLMEYVAQEVGIKPGYLYHTIDSLHAYKKDWLALSSNLEDLQDKY